MQAELGHCVTPLANVARSTAAEGRPVKRYFEARILPGFLEWLETQLVEARADYIVPVETSGAHLLESVRKVAPPSLARVLARSEVVSPSSLDYTPLKDARRRSVVIFDNTVRTGSSIDRLAARLKEVALAESVALACLGRLDDPAPNLPSARVYLNSSESTYVHALRSLKAYTQSARIPPAVDNHCYRLELAPGQHPLGLFADLAAHLGGDPASITSRTSEFTLSFNPGSLGLPTGVEGDLADGVAKVRIFLDLQSGELLVVPMAFPRLSFPAGSSLASTGTALGDTIVRSAQKHADHDRVGYRAVCAFVEQQLLLHFTTLVAAVGATIHALRPSGRHFRYVYGPHACDAVLVAAEADLAAIRHVGQTDIDKPHVGGTQVTFLDWGLRTEGGLIDLVHACYDPAEPDRVLSFGEMRRAVPHMTQRERSALLDMALGLGVMAPRLERTRTACGYDLRRTYKLSEPPLSRSDRLRLGSIDDSRELAHETIAFIAKALRDSSTRFAGQPIPLTAMNKAIAIMRPLLEELDVPLRSAPHHFGAVTRLNPPEGAGSPMSTDPFKDVTRQFVFTDSALRPSEEFLERHGRRALVIQMSDIAVRLESECAAISAIVDQEGDYIEALTVLSMAVDRGFGLTYVAEDLRLGADGLRAWAIEVEGQHRPKHLARHAALARQHFGIAGTKVKSLLVGDPRRLVPPAMTSESASIIRARINWGSDCRPLLEVIRQLCGALSRSARLLDQVGSSANDALALWPESLEQARSAFTSFMAIVRPDLPSPEDEGDLAARVDEVARWVDELALTLRNARTSDGRRPSVAVLAGNPRTRERVMAVADLAGSSRHSAMVEHNEESLWIEEGVNQVARWSRLMGGVEFGRRKGDDVEFEFIKAEPALMALCLAQLHLMARRSFDPDGHMCHVAVGFGQVSDGLGGNRVSGAVDRCAKLLKADGIRELTENVIMTDEAVARLAEAMRERVVTTRKEVDLGASGDVVGATVIEPHVVAQHLGEALDGVAEPSVT